MNLKQLFKKNPPKIPNKIFGTHGRIEIPDLEIEIPLYNSECGNSQSVVDNLDSAVFISYGKYGIIADHVDQGLKNLINAKPGITKVYIRHENGSQESYICECSQVGHIKKSESGNRLFNWLWERAPETNKNSLTIYTCFGVADGDDQRVTLTYWSFDGGIFQLK